MASIKSIQYILPEGVDYEWIHFNPYYRIEPVGAIKSLIEAWQTYEVNEDLNK